MSKVTGIIKKISEEKHTGSYIKKEVDIETGENPKSIAYLEFRGVNRFLLNDIKVGDAVTIDYWHNGKISKLGKSKYNNLVGTAIEKI